MRRRHLVACLVLASACGTDPRTQIMVFVRAEPGVMERTTRLDVDVLAAPPGEALTPRETITYTTASESAFFPLRWPRRIALVPEGDDPSREFAVVARAQDDAGELARARVASSYLEGETLTLDVWLRDACIDRDCADGLICERGECVEETVVDPCSLRRLEGDEVPEGCTPTPDAGTMDAGDRGDAGGDAGRDAGTPPDGGPDAGSDAGATDAGPPGPLDVYNVVFVTSVARAPGSYGDIDGAHEHCQSLALDAGLPEPASYRAFLSTTAATADTLLTGSRGWVRPDGLPFADQPADILAGRTYYPIALTEEELEPSETRVATGTAPNLSPPRSFVAGETCGDWSAETGNVTAGNALDGPRFWIDRRSGLAPMPAATSCGTPLSLYCFGTGRSVALDPPGPPPGTGGAFITSTEIRPGADVGIAGLDALCQSESGSTDYVAFLPAAPDSTALVRLGGYGGPWVRPDGVVVAESVADLAGETLVAPPTQNAFGVYEPDERFWSMEAPPSSTSSFTCAGWTTNAANARFSYVGRARRFYSAAVSRNCDSPPGERVLCLSTAAVH